VRKTGRRILVGAGILVGVLLVLVIGIALFFDVNRYKPQIESAVAKSTGMNLKINGKASLKIFPHVRIAMRDVHLSNHGSELFAANEVQVAPRLVPFVRHREIIVDRVALIQPKIHVEKSASGRMNYETAKQGKTPAGKAGQKAGGAGQVGVVEVENGDVTYVDHAAGTHAQVSGIHLELNGVSWSGQSADLMKSVVLRGKFRAQSLKTDSLAASDLKADIRDNHGLIDLNPTVAAVFGGTLKGEAQVDLRGSVPKLKLAQTGTHLDLAQLASKAKGRAVGFVDAKANLTAAGKGSNALTRTASGTVSVRGQDISLVGVDLDAIADKIGAAKGADLAKLGGSLVSGLLAPVAGQAAGIAGSSSQPKTVIRTLVSDWKINHGIAETQDVALATAKNTLALRGAVNLINKTFQNFYVGVVDPKGCSKAKIQVSGPLNHPKPVVGSIVGEVSQSALGAAGSALGSTGSQIAGILGGATQPPQQKQGQQAEPSGCDHFYGGSLVHPG
jgi:uncharacterized protein YhdP